MASHVYVVDSTFKRQQIKVSPNTYLRDVLEEACEKMKLSNPDQYTLKYVNLLNVLSFLITHHISHPCNIGLYHFTLFYARRYHLVLYPHNVSFLYSISVILFYASYPFLAILINPFPATSSRF